MREVILFLKERKEKTLFDKSDSRQVKAITAAMIKVMEKPTFYTVSLIVVRYLRVLY